MALPELPSQRVVISSFTLESGVTLLEAPIAFTSYGRLSKTRDNVIVVCYGFLANLQVHKWWSDLLGPGKALDTSRYFVICLNSLGSPFGSASPLTSIDGDRGKGPYGPNFPLTTIRDDVRIHKLVLDTLRIISVRSVIGGSMGGMLALEWVFLGEHYIKSFISIAAASQQGAWAISWNEVERAIVRADPKFNGGYYPSSDPPKEGLSAARMTGLLTYRSPGSYEARFGRTIVTKSHHELIDSAAATLTQASAEKVNLTPTADSPFLVQSYLQHKAQEFCRLFDANCYISLTQKLDSHDITRGRIYKSIECPVAETLRCLNQPALVVGISLDILYLWTEQERMAKNLKNAQKKLIISGEGHDAFLIHTQDLNRMIADFIRSFERGDISTGARRASHERLITGDSGGQWR